jgi:dTDP-4-amino-4,6-dideoxygalactose transaminase
LGAGVFYPLPANRQAHLTEMDLGNTLLSVTEELAKKALSLLMHPQLIKADLDAIIAEVNKL